MSIAEKLTTVAENQQRVFDAGKKAEYDKMWDGIQLNGTTDYAVRNGVFNGRLFTFDNFYPKYDIRPVGDASFLFYAWEPKYGNVRGSLKQRLNECGVVLDTSQATNISQMFNYGYMDDIPTIDCTGLTTAGTNVFANSYGTRTTIEKVIVKEDVTFSNWFNNCSALANITFEGVIGQDINFGSCPLSKASIKSVISALSATASGKTATFKKEAVENAFGSTTVDEWTTLIATKSNWTITLL